MKGVVILLVVNHNITSKKRTRNEAYKAAFKKADELINKNKDEN
jgi:hypothetical protein